MIVINKAFQNVLTAVIILIAWLICFIPDRFDPYIKQLKARNKSGGKIHV